MEKNYVSIEEKTITYPLGRNVELSLLYFSALYVEGFACRILLVLVEDIKCHEFDFMIEVSVIFMLTI